MLELWGKRKKDEEEVIKITQGKSLKKILNDFCLKTWNNIQESVMPLLFTHRCASKGNFFLGFEIFLALENWVYDTLQSYFLMKSELCVYLFCECFVNFWWTVKFWLAIKIETWLCHWMLPTLICVIFWLKSTQKELFYPTATETHDSCQSNKTKAKHLRRSKSKMIH